MNNSYSQLKLKNRLKSCLVNKSNERNEQSSIQVNLLGKIQDPITKEKKCDRLLASKLELNLNQK